MNLSAIIYPLQTCFAKVVTGKSGNASSSSAAFRNSSGSSNTVRRRSNPYDNPVIRTRLSQTDIFLFPLFCIDYDIINENKFDLS